MPENADSGIPPKPQVDGEVKARVLPIGDRILGEEDPRAMSQEEFDASPDLLFHGALEPFNFERKIINGPNSQTIGTGFYATDDRENAVLYSKIRKNFQGEPDVVSVLPYQARVLDLRSQDNPLNNAPVSKEFMTEYREFVIAYTQELFPNGQPDMKADRQGFLRYQNLKSYRSDLNMLIFGEGSAPLRAMMTPERGSSEFFANAFTQFMRSKGYDGLVYNEGGDHPDQKHTTSYVFYNPDKIGTYDTWHGEEMPVAA